MLPETVTNERRLGGYENGIFPAMVCRLDYIQRMWI